MTRGIRKWGRSSAGGLLMMLSRRKKEKKTFGEAVRK